MTENRLLVFVHSESYAKLPHVSEFQTEKKRLLEENSLKVWNIHENKARTKTHKAGPALHRQREPPHSAQRISHLMATRHGWKLPPGSSALEFWKELGISHIFIVTKSREKNYWQKAFNCLNHIFTRKLGVWFLFKLEAIYLWIPINFTPPRSNIRLYCVTQLVFRQISAIYSNFKELRLICFRLDFYRL